MSSTPTTESLVAFVKDDWEAFKKLLAENPGDADYLVAWIDAKQCEVPPRRGCSHPTIREITTISRGIVRTCSACHEEVD